MQIDIHDIVIASLLHDIGKVMQRAELAKPLQFEDRCPLNKNSYPSRLHVMWTESFFHENPVRSDLTWWEKLAALAASHHKTESFEPRSEKWIADCIAMGDRISSNWDRGESEKSNSLKYKKRPLYPVFDKVNLDLNKPKSETNFGKYSIPMMPKSSFTEQIISSGQIYNLADETKSKSEQYRSLFDHFSLRFRLLAESYDNRQISKEQFSNSLEYLVQEFFWCVPSNTMESQPSNSLYHHSRMTAAVASALFSAYKKNPEDMPENPEPSKIHLPFLLLGGDLSGIQDYIFDLNPEKSKLVSKTLRARSCKVKIISDMVIHSVINTLGLSWLNVLSDVGGKFMILIPSTEKMKSGLIAIRKNCENDFIKKFQGILSLNLNWETEIHLDDLNQVKLENTMRQVNLNFDNSKKQKHITHFTESGKWNSSNFMVDSKPVYADNLCPICARHAVSNQDSEDSLCVNCSEDRSLGAKLPKMGYGIIQSEKQYDTVIAMENLKVYFSMKQEPPKKNLGNSLCFAFRHQDKQEYVLPVRNIASHLPTDNGDNILTFDEIAERAVDSVTARGVAMNAILKGDVDNLGSLISVGLKSNEYPNSITKYSTFSTEMDYFFSQLLPEMVKAKYPDIYIIYSGGDDFALLGPWNTVICFTQKLNELFKIFVNGNPDIHFSAGIELLHGRQPIGRAVQRAERNLKDSKSHPARNNKNTSTHENDKHAVTLLGSTLKFDQLPALIDLAEKMDEWLSNETGFTTQFIYRLMQYTDMHISYKDSSRAKDLMYVSHLSYDSRRNIKKSRYRDEILNAVQTWMDVDYPLMEYLKIPIQIALYTNRKTPRRVEE